MPGTRLRQICLVAPQLEPAVGDIAAIMGLQVCYRDSNVERYGLTNALLPVNDVLLEVVAPFREGTAAGRFIEKTGGRGGYMAIFSCDDPRERERNAESMGVRVSHVIDRPPYLGVQLHPRDCRAAFIEFNHTVDSDNVFGPYPPAGPDWHTAIRKDVTTALTDVEMASPNPRHLADHWSRILGVPVSRDDNGFPIILLANGKFRFVEGVSEIMTALSFAVADNDGIKKRAASRGYDVSGNSFAISGVDFRLVA